MATPWETTPQGKAEGYGWSWAVVNSDPELKKLFMTASSQNWTADHFTSMVRGTKWFKTHGDTYRQAFILFKADRSTFDKNVTSSALQVMTIAKQMGVRADNKALTTIGRGAYMLGWNQDQVKNALLKYVTPNSGGNYLGGAATFQQQYTELGAQYGIQDYLGKGWSAKLNAWVKGSVDGGTTPEAVKLAMTQMAMAKYPALAERLKAGETLQQIADPYVQSYSKVLEVNPNAVKLSDPLVQQALSSSDPAGKPAAKSVWQFEQELKSDPRYMKTQGAQDSGMSMAHKVLSDLGIQS